MPCFEPLPPVLVFWLWPWPKPGLMRSVIVRPVERPGSLCRGCAVLVDHVGRAAVDVEVVLDDELERFAVEEVGGEDDLGRMRLLARLEAGRERAVNLAGAHGVDHHAVAAHQVEDRQVGAGLLGVADRVELASAGRCGGRSGRRRRRRRACRSARASAGIGSPAMSVT